MCARPEERTTPGKVLVVRNDKLGDFMLAWPAFALLKASMPDCRVEALVPEYTRELAALCPWIDGLVADPAPDQHGLALSGLLRRRAYDAVVTLYSTARVGFAVWRARIPTRIAPATKVAQVFYNHRIQQRRSRSEKPEYVYNLELAERLVERWRYPVKRPAPPYLRFEPNTIAAARARFCARYAVDRRRLLIFIHAGSGGSATNLSLPQYAALASKLVSDRQLLVLSAGPRESAQVHRLAALLGTSEHVLFESRDGLVNYAQHIAFCDLFVSGSTGPLHIAGALNRPTAAFYPRRRSATALRWQTMNEEARRLAFSPPPAAADNDMSGIDLDQAATTISGFLARSSPPVI